MMTKAPSLLSRHALSGFSLLEVLVSLVIVSLGLLGISKMQAAAVSNTQIARTRSLVAFQVSSLAAAMHGNRAYWADAAEAPKDVTVKGATVKGMAVDAECLVAACTPSGLAGYDVQRWAIDMDDHFFNYEASIKCTSAATTPVNCIIQVKWKEKLVAINRSSANAVVSMPEDDPSYVKYFTLFVEP